MEYWTPKGEGAGVRAVADPRAAGALPRPVAGPDRVEGELELHPCRRVRVVSHRHDARRAQRGRDRRRRLDGPAARAAVREGDPGRLARARHRSAGQCRRLHREPELRLHAHLVVAEPDAAAARRVQPARGVREAVRRCRQHRADGARGAAAPAQEPPRFGEREAHAPAARPRPRGSGEDRRVHRVDPRRRAPDPESRGAARSRDPVDRPAAGRPAGVRGSRGADARPSAAGVPVGPHPGHHRS